MGAIACLALVVAPGLASARTLEHKLAPPQGLGGYAGWAVDIDGDTAVVGAPLANGIQGAAHVYTRTEDGWEYAQTLTPAAQTGGYLGMSVAIDGDTIVVGAPLAAFGANGRVFVFTRNASGVWEETTSLTAGTPSEGGLSLGIGWSVAIDGDTIVAGAPGYFFLTPDPGDTDPGTVYVFDRTGPATWTLTGELTRSAATPGDLLGWSVAIDGDTVVSGAPELLGAGGAVYTFARSGATVARTETARLTIAGAPQASLLGISVAIDGDVIVAGAPGTGFGGFEPGAVYTFATAGEAERTETGRLVASVDPETASVGLGLGVDIEGATIAASAFAFGEDGQSFRPLVYTFARTGPSPRPETERLLTAPGAAGYPVALFGLPVALSGGTIIVGAPLTDGEERGAAFVSGPDTEITSGPAEGSVITTATPTFAFTSETSPVTFQCRIDDGDWAPCTSPSQRGPLDEGEHTFYVRAIDQYGDVDPTPATRTFTVALNEPPVAVNDAYNVIGGAVLSVPAPGVLGNDSDPDGDAITAQLVDDVSSGTLALAPDGSFTYTPGEDTVGPVTFTYRAFDGTAVSNVATVTITVTAGCDGVAATIVGTSASQTINGTGGDDVIVGLGGNDRIDSGSGNDRVCGGSGDDVIDTGSDNDIVLAGSGADRVTAGSGDDRLDGGDGDDRLDGGGDRDRLFGQDGADRLLGGGGDDQLEGGAGGPDVCNGEGGTDTPTGGCEQTLNVP